MRKLTRYNEIEKLFDIDYANEDTEIRCPTCQQWSSIDDWEMTEAPCEDCGSHSALKCPKCQEVFDGVAYYSRFESRDTTAK